MAPQLILVEQEGEFDADEAELLCDFDRSENETDILYDVVWYFGGELVHNMTLDMLAGDNETEIMDAILQLGDFEEYNLRDGVSHPGPLNCF